MIRNEISKLKKPQEAIVLETEATMEALDQEQEEIYAALAEAKPDTDFAALNRRLIEIKKEMDHEATRWEEAADKLERLSAECNTNRRTILTTNHTKRHEIFIGVAALPEGIARGFVIYKFSPTDRGQISRRKRQELAVPKVACQ